MAIALIVLWDFLEIRYHSATILPLNKARGGLYNGGLTYKSDSYVEAYLRGLIGRERHIHRLN